MTFNFVSSKISFATSLDRLCSPRKGSFFLETERKPKLELRNQRKQRAQFRRECLCLAWSVTRTEDAEIRHRQMQFRLKLVLICARNVCQELIFAFGRKQPGSGTGESKTVTIVEETPKFHAWNTGIQRHAWPRMFKLNVNVNARWICVPQAADLPGKVPVPSQRRGLLIEYKSWVLRCFNVELYLLQSFVSDG